MAAALFDNIAVGEHCGECKYQGAKHQQPIIAAELVYPGDQRLKTPVIVDKHSLRFNEGFSFCPKVVHIALILNLYSRRHVDRPKDDESGKSNHEVKREDQDTSDIMRIEPGPMRRRFGTKRKKILKDAMMNDDSGHERDRHSHGRGAHDPGAGLVQ